MVLYIEINVTWKTNILDATRFTFNGDILFLSQIVLKFLLPGLQSFHAEYPFSD